MIMRPRHSVALYKYVQSLPDLLLFLTATLLN